MPTDNAVMPASPPTQPAPKAQAMLLAAGRGERMRPLTDTCPKPLLQVQGKPLMQWHLEALATGGFSYVVINTAWLENLIIEKYSNKFQSLFTKELHNKLFNSYQNRSNKNNNFNIINIKYSLEGRDFGGPLETAGGISRALPQLDDIFWVLAADVYTPTFQFTATAFETFRASGKLAHLWLVQNPAHNAKGDFGMQADGLALNLPASSQEPRYTFSTIALYRKEFFNALPFGNPGGIKAPLAPMLRAAMDNQTVSAELYTGHWTDVGTPERLAELNRT